MTLKNGVGWILSNALEQRSPTTGPQSWSWIYHEGLLNPGRETDWATCYSGSPSVVQGWRVVVLSQLTAASTFQAEAILPSQPPNWLRLQVGPSSFRKTSLTRPLILHYAPTSQQPRQAQNSLQSASTDEGHDS
ncbi:uncharacterized protein [Gorilla gorilla gorilla]|uniref:uncharacterized protein n=1 Tax=Gorilla gorilla gorilla TaxID=9595 RepID=UPI00300B9735